MSHVGRTAKNCAAFSSDSSIATPTKAVSSRAPRKFDTSQATRSTPARRLAPGKTTAVRTELMEDAGRLGDPPRQGCRDFSGHVCLRQRDRISRASAQHCRSFAETRPSDSFCAILVAPAVSCTRRSTKLRITVGKPSAWPSHDTPASSLRTSSRLPTIGVMMLGTPRDAASDTTWGFGSNLLGTATTSHAAKNFVRSLT